MSIFAKRLQLPRFTKSIGIVGGAGPMASSFLYRTILEICQHRYEANDYNEFPEIILLSYPFTRGDAEIIKEEISLAFLRLKIAGAKVFCVASHSFHGYLPDITNMHFVDLIGETLKKASQLTMSRALIISAQSTRDQKLYEQGELECLYPSMESQRDINNIIREVAQGVITIHQAKALKGIITQCYQRQPFDGIILACTELPLIHKSFSLSLGDSHPRCPVIDTIEVLAERLVALSAEEVQIDD
ncbi:MAG: aspartate/glutamate racemase family protein [Simkania sp.]|nr:aspartate/glutamate racemase family protein [Simkania sp.]